MDTPFALQTYLQQYGPLTTALTAYNNGVPPPEGGVFLLELPSDLPESRSQVPPFGCTVVRAAGGPAHHGKVLPLRDNRIIMQSYGQTPHIAYNIDSIVYQALKSLRPSVWAGTFIHWAVPETLGLPLRDPDLQWPYVSSVWATLASDMTIT